LHSGKILTKETRKLIQIAALNRKFSEETLAAPPTGSRKNVYK